ncbi:MAG TPA: arginine--tRNA ligase [Patescibacteria group bacterium]|nr:arginine--tRNA ligase [Patescibacteria group bacterium]
MPITKEREIGYDFTNERYPIVGFEKGIKGLIKNYTGYNGEITITEAPANSGSDFGIQTSSIARAKGENPVSVAQSLSQKGWSHPYIDEVRSQGPYLNFRLEYGTFGLDVVNGILSEEANYGMERKKEKGRVIVDMSSPNIAKRMSYGHLRSTIIGDAVSNLYISQGYDVVRDNHIGDWGTQFGKQIAAIKMWGDEKELMRSSEPVGDLQELYQKFHQEAEKHPELEDLGRQWFLKLEQGDKEARRLWKMCVDLSMKEFDRVYKTLGVRFDVAMGESFYEKMLPSVMKQVDRSPISSRSEGALVVDMKDRNLGVAIIQKSDGASVYMTRDLATAMYREKKMGAEKAVYVVGEDQKLYFQQLFQILQGLGYEIGEKSDHVYFGMVRMEEGKMSTRKGRTILLDDVIKEGLERERQVISNRNPKLFNSRKREEVVRQVAIGALKWNDLSRDPRRSIVFDWDEALNMEGFSAPYVQYAAVRANAILEHAGVNHRHIAQDNPEGDDVYKESSEQSLIKKLAAYPKAVKLAQEQNNPSIVATNVYEVAKEFNSFYRNNPVLRGTDKNLILSRLKLVGATSQVIKNGLGILGIEVPDVM